MSHQTSVGSGSHWPSRTSSFVILSDFQSTLIFIMRLWHHTANDLDVLSSSVPRIHVSRPHKVTIQAYFQKHFPSTDLII